MGETITLEKGKLPVAIMQVCLHGKMGELFSAVPALAILLPLIGMEVESYLFKEENENG